MIIILEDCKFSMAEIDLQRIEEWLLNAAKPIVNSDKKNKILPILDFL